MPRFHYYKTESPDVLLLEILDEKTKLCWHLMVNRKKDELNKELVTYSQGYRDHVEQLGAARIECPKAVFMNSLSKMQQQSAMFAHAFKDMLKAASKEQ